MTAVKFPKPERRPKVRKPLRARKPMRRRSPRRLSKPGAADGQRYMAFVRTLPCCVQGLPGAGKCDGSMTASHIRSHTGLGLKPDDKRTTPMCGKHHLYHWEERRGAFLGWTEGRRQRWASGVIVETQLKALFMGCLPSPSEVAA